MFLWITKPVQIATHTQITWKAVVIIQIFSNTRLEGEVRWVVKSFPELSVDICDQPPINKLGGVGPIDNRPSNNNLHHFVIIKINIIIMIIFFVLTHDMWHWQVTHDMLHMTHDMCHMVRGEHSLEISAP